MNEPLDTSEPLEASPPSRPKLIIQYRKDTPPRTTAPKPARYFVWFFLDGVEVAQCSMPFEVLEELQSGKFHAVPKP